MGHRDSRYRLTELVEVDDGYLGANKTGKAGRTDGRTPVLVAIGRMQANPVFVAIEALPSLAKPYIVDFAKRRLQLGAVAHTDAFSSLTGLTLLCQHIARITPPEEADEWLPWVHIVISDLKRFLVGTYHGAVPPLGLQEYLDDFAYPFNRRLWEPQIPNRLLSLCVEHLLAALRGT